MTEYKPRDKKVQGYTTSQILHAMNEIERAEGKKMSAVVHDALTAYTSNHPDVQLSVKRDIKINEFSTEMAKLSEIASKANEYDEFEANFIHFCTNLNRIESNSPQELSLIGDVILLLTKIKAHHNKEYDRCIKIARKMVTKRVFNQLSPDESDISRKTSNQMISKEHDRKELSIGQYNEKYR